nr:YggS family pyridoxal phosphate-dependent enzyme [Desulfobulbaceae bacterium]
MIKENLQEIYQQMAAAAIRSGRRPEDVKLVAVSKRKPIAAIKCALEAGQHSFGENYLQDAIEKITEIPQARWHFIGRIQSNKTKLIAQHFNVVETVDRLKIAEALEKHLATLGKSLDAYVQVNIGDEDQKAGVSVEELEGLVRVFNSFSHLKLIGLMGLPPFNEEPEATRKHFRQLRRLAQSLEDKKIVDHPLGLSMGMSADFEVAIEEGATLVRVGTAIFGDRE